VPARAHVHSPDATKGTPVLPTPMVTLIAARPDEAVPTGIPLDHARLPSLHTVEVRRWIADHHDHDLYLVPGRDIATGGTPTLSVPVSVDEYRSLLHVASP
jgi:hypothetical protein